jgi:hypothetical protein
MTSDVRRQRVGLNALRICAVLVGAVLSIACSRQVNAADPTTVAKWQLIQGPTYSGSIYWPSREEAPWMARSLESRAFWIPSADVIAELESSLPDALENGSHHPGLVDEDSRHSQMRAAFVSEELGKIIAYLGQYERQYIGLILSDGTRLILVNCFLQHDQDAGNPGRVLQSRWVEVDDGGFNYWRIRYDPERKVFLGFDSNGYA